MADGGLNFGGFGGNFFSNANTSPGLGQLGGMFNFKPSALDPQVSPFSYGQAPNLSASQIANMSDSDFNSIGQIGAGKAGQPFDVSKLAGLLGTGGQAPAPQTQMQSKGSNMIDPLYLVKQFVPQIADRYSAVSRTLNTRVPLLRGLLG